MGGVGEVGAEDLGGGVGELGELMTASGCGVEARGGEGVRKLGWGMWRGEKRGGGELVLYPARTVAHHENIAAAFAAVDVAFGVQSRQANAVLLHAVDEGPVVNELEAGRHEETDFFGEGARQDLRGRCGGFVDAAEGERRERWGLEGRGGAVGGGVDARHGIW